MQDRYAGDVGDYGKIALLRFLQAQGFSIGVNLVLIGIELSNWKVRKIRTAHINRMTENILFQRNCGNVIPLLQIA